MSADSVLRSVKWARWLAPFGLVLALTGCLFGGAVDGAGPTATPVVEHTPTPEVFISRTAAVPAGATITGRALWGRAPVAGVQVELRTGAWSDPANSETIAQAVTDNSGVYAIEAPPNGGDFGLVALWPDGAANTAPVTPVQVEPGGPDVQADVALARPLDWLEPASGAAVATSVTLRWRAVQDAATYHVWVIDAGTTALAFDVIVPANAEGDPGAVLTPLKSGRTYTWDVQALDAGGALLARTTGSLQTPGQAVPDACREDGLSSYIDQAHGYCFAYPAAFTAQINEAGNPLIAGPALDSGAEPLRASLLVEIETVAQGKTLAEIVDDYLVQFEGLDAPPVTRTAVELAGQPAELLEVVPGREGSRDIFMLYEGTLFHLVFMPSARDLPQAASDLQQLSVTVVATFNLMPLATGGF